jgi:antitoxin VapB
VQIEEAMKTLANSRSVAMTTENSRVIDNRDPQSPEAIVKALDELSRSHAARPVCDSRTADEIAGYDENGLPQ